MVTVLVYSALILVSVVSAVLGFYSVKYAIAENRGALKYRAWGLLLLAAGLIIHTFGDYVSPSQGIGAELGWESFAHVIIFVAFILFIMSANDILNNARRYWFK